MNIRLWSWKPLLTDLRGVFELPSWPYRQGKWGPMDDDCQAYLQNIGVVRLECEGEITKLLVPVTSVCPYYEQGEFPIKWQPRWKCYRSFGHLDDETLVVRKWNRKNPNFETGVGDKAPDNFCWFEWNTRVTVLTMNSSFINYE